MNFRDWESSKGKLGWERDELDWLAKAAILEKYAERLKITATALFPFIHKEPNYI